MSGKPQGGFNPYNQGHTVEVNLAVAVNLHADGDTIGGRIKVTVDLSKSWKGCELLGVSIIDNGAKANASTLYIFRELPSVFADDVEWVPLRADLAMLAPGHKGLVINAGDWETFTTSDKSTVSVAAMSIDNIALDLRNGIPSTFYAYLIDNTGFTPAAVDDWSLYFHFRID